MGGSYIDLGVLFFHQLIFPGRGKETYWLSTKFEAISMYVLYSFAWAAKPIISPHSSLLPPFLLRVSPQSWPTVFPPPYVVREKQGEHGMKGHTHSSNLHSKSPQPTPRNQNLLPTPLLRKFPPKNLKDRRITCVPFLFPEITPIPHERPERRPDLFL